MKKLVKWAIILLPVTILSILVLKMVILNFGSVGYISGPHHHQGLHGNKFGPFSRGMHHVDYVTIFGLTLLSLITKLALILVGWFMWRSKKDNKLMIFTGAVLFTLGVFFVLPTILGIPFILVMSYFLYKTINQHEVSYFIENKSEFHNAFNIQQHSTPDFLDEWEKVTRREER